MGVRRVLRWLLAPRAGTGLREYRCPRCAGVVMVPGTPLGAVRRFGYWAPTVAEVATRCGCEAAGRAAVPEWRERARKPYASW